MADTPVDPPEPAPVFSPPVKVALKLDPVSLVDAIKASGMPDALEAAIAAINGRLPKGLQLTPEQLSAQVTNIVGHYGTEVLAAITGEVLAAAKAAFLTGKGPIDSGDLSAEA